MSIWPFKKQRDVNQLIFDCAEYRRLADLFHLGHILARSSINGSQTTAKSQKDRKPTKKGNLMNILDKLFQDAADASLADKNQDISIKIVLILSYANLNWSAVRYSEGSLFYHRSSTSDFYAAPDFFASKPKAGRKSYDLKSYSNQKRGSTPLDVSGPNPNAFPFDHSPGATSTVTAAIRRPVFSSNGNYSITFFDVMEHTSELIFDDASLVFYGGFGNTFITVGLSKMIYKSH